MSPAVIVANLLAASGQAAVVVALATLLVWLLRLDIPGVRYVLWRTIAIACLLLPWIQHYQPLGRGAVRTAIVTVESGTAAATGATGASLPDMAGLALAVLGAGVALRLAWLLVGVIRLRHLRRAGFSAETELETDLQQTLGTRASVRYSTRVTQPVTFGLLTPVVLVPESLRCQPDEIQRAVIGHELIHVKRHDWAWLLVEEVVVSVLWFHPAAWWVASRIQLAREEVVDELAVLLTGRRKPYVEALLAFSDPMSIVPTAAFARRRHLLRRIALLSREDVMSSKRIVASCAVMALVVVAGAWRAVAAFPLQTRSAQLSQVPAGPGPLERRAHPVTPENPVPRRVYFQEPVVPDIAGSTSAKVELKITLDETGAVAEARPTAIRAGGTGLGNLQITDDNLITKIRTTTLLDMPGLPSTVRDSLLAIVDSAVTSVRAWRYDPPAAAPLTFNISIQYGDALQSASGGSEDQALHVGGAIKSPVKLVDVRPVYPEDARAAGVKGVVIVEARIGADGSVEDAHVLKSIKELDQAAIDAVKQWKFVPTLMNGVPKPVVMVVTINFIPE